MSGGGRPALVARLSALLDREVVRYVLVGGANTAVGYGLFVVLQLSLGRIWPYTLVQVLSNLIAMVQAYWLQRWLVFRFTGGWWGGLLRFASVYAGAFAFNLAAVAALVELAGVAVIPAGGIAVVLQAVGTYVANKWFTFRRRGGTPVGDAGAPDAPSASGRVEFVG